MISFSGARVGTFAAAAVGSLLLMNCNGKGTTQPDEAIGDPEVDVSAEIGSVIERHNARVQRLRHFYANGTIMLRWMDADGSHSEQGNIELWADLPDRLAIRIYKAAIGEDFLKLGMNADRAWVLDLRPKPPDLLLIESMQQALSGKEGLPISMNPRAIVDMMGLATLPNDLPGNAACLSEDASKWVVQTTADSGRIRIEFDRKSGFPTAVRQIGPDGDVLLKSTVAPDKYERIELDRESPMDYPRFPMRFWIDHETEAGGSISITFNEATGRASDSRWTEKAFDLDRLIRQHEPQVRRIEDKGE